MRNIKPCLRKLTVTLILLGASSFPLMAQGTETLQGLDLFNRLEVPEMPLGSTPRDIRWATGDSVFITFERDGVIEFDVGEQLSRKRELFPPRHNVGGKSIQNLNNLASSAKYLVAFGFGNEVGWRELDSTSEIQLKHVDRHYFDDVDVQGDKVAILGYPGGEYSTEGENAYLWLGDLRSELSQWRPLRELSLPAPANARGTFSRHLGSLRFMHNGDLLVVPVVKPGVFRHAQSGKLKAFWSPEELESSLLAALGGSEPRLEKQEKPLSMTEATSDPEKIRSHVESLRMVIEDVLPLGKRSAVLVRYRTASSSGFYLGVLGAETHWFKVPIGKHPASVRVRADYLPQTDRIVLLVTDRSLPTEGTDRRVYVVRAP
ncbi:MAG: hypothetical protein ABIV06_14335 [Thermoanaerobaculia bacterium]